MQKLKHVSTALKWLVKTLLPLPPPPPGTNALDRPRAPSGERKSGIRMGRLISIPFKHPGVYVCEGGVMHGPWNARVVQNVHTRPFS